MSGATNCRRIARLIMARLCGDDAIKGMHIHHIDSDPHNNAPENLVILNPKEHGAIRRQTPDGDSTDMILRDVPRSVRYGLKIEAAIEGRTMQDLVVEILEDHLKAKKGEAK